MENSARAFSVWVVYAVMFLHQMVFHLRSPAVFKRYNMKTSKILLAIVAVFALAISSCDYVIDPDEITTSGGGGTGTSDTIVIDSIRRVLLEDYTGHKCTACPEIGRAS